MPELTPLASLVAEKLKHRGETVAVTESSTGGLISAALLAVPGASAYFVGGSLVYTLESRKKILGITRDDVAGMEPLTQEMVSAFAQKARRQLNTTWSISELGVAGPTGARYGHPPGVSVIGIDGPNPMAVDVSTGSADREANMWAFTEAALDLFNQALE